MRGYSGALLLLVLFVYDPVRVNATYGWAQARTSLGRSLGDVIYEQPNSQGQQHKSDLRDSESPHNTPASKVRLWLDQDCGFTALLEGTQVFSKHGPVNGDFSVNFDEMLLDCTEGKSLQKDHAAYTIQAALVICNSMAEWLTFSKPYAVSFCKAKPATTVLRTQY